MFVVLEMALLRYLNPQNGLPDPRGSLSSTIPTQAIAQANEQVQEAIHTEKEIRGPYKKYSPTVQAEMGKYACHRGMAAAACFFSRRLEKKVSESTVRSIKSAYVEGVRQKKADDGGDITVLRLKKCGRPVLLGQELDTNVLKKVRDVGGIVTARITMAAARGILLKCDRTKLAEFGGPVQLNRHWAHSLLKHIKFVQRKAYTSKSKQTAANFTELKSHSLLMSLQRSQWKTSHQS